MTLFDLYSFARDDAENLWMKWKTPLTDKSYLFVELEIITEILLFCVCLSGLKSLLISWWWRKNDCWKVSIFDMKSRNKRETNVKPTWNQGETNVKPTWNQRETNRKPTGNQRETNGKPTGNKRENIGKGKPTQWVTLFGKWVLFYSWIIMLPQLKKIETNYSSFNSPPFDFSVHFHTNRHDSQDD